MEMSMLLPFWVVIADDVGNHIKNPPGYEILLLNVQSVTGKAAATWDIILDERADLPHMTETWLEEEGEVKLS